MFDLSNALKLDDPLLPPKQAASLLSIAVQTLAVWRHRGKTDLPYIRLGPRTIRYRKSDVTRFIDQRRFADVDSIPGKFDSKPPRATELHRAPPKSTTAGDPFDAVHRQQTA